MRIKGISKSGVFLIELVLVILFFSFCCTITLQLFVKSALLSKNAKDLSNGMMVAQSAVEKDKRMPFQALVPGEQTIYFHQDWSAADEADSTYALQSKVSFSPQEAGTMAELSYTIYKGEEQIFSLEAKKYYSGVNGEADQDRREEDEE